MPVRFVCAGKEKYFSPFPFHHRHENAVSIAEVIKRKVGECCRGLPAEDDMTLITFKFGDGPKAAEETS